MSTLIIDRVYDGHDTGGSENPFSPQKALFHEVGPIVEAYKHGFPPKASMLQNSYMPDDQNLYQIGGEYKNGDIHLPLHHAEAHKEKGPSTLPSPKSPSNTTNGPYQASNTPLPSTPTAANNIANQPKQTTNNSNISTTKSTEVQSSPEKLAGESRKSASSLISATAINPNQTSPAHSNLVTASHTPNGVAGKRECIAETIIVPNADGSSMGRVKVETVILTKKGEILNASGDGINGQANGKDKKKARGKCCQCVVS